MALPYPSLVDRVTPVETGVEVIACAWLNSAPVFALASGAALFAEGSGWQVDLHKNATILVAASDSAQLVTGGDDGNVIWMNDDGDVSKIASAPGRWIDALALSPSGAVAWSVGKIVYACDDKGEIKTLAVPSSVRGLAFAPKGYRLAISHYNGVSLWFPNTAAPPEVFEWKGSHIDVTVSPDGRFIVTSMQESMLHGWRVADKAHMRMSGYPSKPRSLSWSMDGHWLATSGADAAIVWPFQAKDGPMGKAPRECGARASKVSRVAFHPRALVLAIGYDDGCVLLCRLTDAAEFLVRPASGSAVIAMAWDPNGAQLAFATEKGSAGILALPVE